MFAIYYSSFTFFVEPRFLGLFLETRTLGIKIRNITVIKAEVNESIGSQEVSKKSVSSHWYLL